MGGLFEASALLRHNGNLQNRNGREHLTSEKCWTQFEMKLNAVVLGAAGGATRRHSSMFLPRLPVKACSNFVCRSPRNQRNHESDQRIREWVLVGRITLRPSPVCTCFFSGECVLSGVLRFWNNNIRRADAEVPGMRQNRTPADFGVFFFFTRWVH